MDHSLEATTVETAKELGLLPEEFEKIKEILGRTPNFNELSIYSVMWSEHCSYKNSIVWLKTLPKDGPHMLVKAGEENAGLVDIGDGLACAFKIESHNHPSAVEPYQGAATGVVPLMKRPTLDARAYLPQPGLPAAGRTLPSRRRSRRSTRSDSGPTTCSTSGSRWPDVMVTPFIR